MILNRKDNIVNDGYFERHHILPRSLGGSDENDNIVNLTAKEHYIAHRLLVEIYKDDKFKYSKMLHAYLCMAYNKSGNQERYYSSKNIFQI